VSSFDASDLKKIHDGIEHEPGGAHDHVEADVTDLQHPHANDHAASHTHASHTGIGAADHHASFVQANADALYSVLGHSHGGGSEAFPVGAIYLNVTGTNPGTELGYGTWSAIAAGRVLVGRDAGDADFDTAEETGGAKTTTLTTTELPAHAHSHDHLTNRFPTATGGSTGHTADTSMSGTQVATNELTDVDATSTGTGSAFSLMNPYFVVHVWKRTA